MRVARQLLGRAPDLGPLKLREHLLDQPQRVPKVHLVSDDLVVELLGLRRQILLVKHFEHLLLEFFQGHHFWHRVHLL